MPITTNISKLSGKANIPQTRGYCFGKKAQHDGFYYSPKERVLAEKSFVQDLAPMLAALTAAPAQGFELTLYTKTGLGDGQQANNPGYKNSLTLSPA